jgi:hypothetical protein
MSYSALLMASLSALMTTCRLIPILFVRLVDFRGYAFLPCAAHHSRCLQEGPKT